MSGFSQVEVGETLPVVRPGKKSIPYTEDPEILARLEVIAQHMLKGVQAHRIAEKLSMPLGTIKRDMGRVKTIWRKQSKSKISDYRSASEAQYKLTIAKAWEMCDIKPDKVDRYLMVIIRAQERIDALTGVEAPEVVDVNIQVKDIEEIRRRRWDQVRSALGVVGDVPVEERQDVSGNPG